VETTRQLLTSTVVASAATTINSSSSSSSRRRRPATTSSQVASASSSASTWAATQSGSLYLRYSARLWELAQLYCYMVELYGELAEEGREGEDKDK